MKANPLVGLLASQFVDADMLTLFAKRDLRDVKVESMDLASVTKGQTALQQAHLLTPSSVMSCQSESCSLPAPSHTALEFRAPCSLLLI